MATIKSYTDLSQSKKLAEILPLESADMYYFRQIDSDYFPPNIESICPIPLYKDGKEDFNYDIRCWSLAALLGVLQYPNLFQNGDEKWGCGVWIDTTKPYLLLFKDSPIDACYEMVLKLHELNLL